MPIANSNRVSETLTTDQEKQLHDAFDVIEAIVSTFVVGLSATERSVLPKISNSNKTFTGDALLGAKQNPELLPSYVKVEEMEKDYVLYNQLDPYVERVNKLFVKLSDTQMLAGSEAYTGALTVYKLASSAADGGVPGANALYQMLKTRFLGQGNFGTGETPVVAAPASN